MGLYVLLVNKGLDQESEIVGPLGEGSTWNGSKSKYGNEDKAACLEWISLQGRKDKLQQPVWKDCACKSKKYCNMKMSYLSVYFDKILVFYRSQVKARPGSKDQKSKAPQELVIVLLENKI